MKKILIVEDNKRLLEIYQKKLGLVDFEISTAATGEEGLREAKSLVPDLVILDIMLPGGLNGFDVLEQLKRDQSTAGIPVIILTNLDAEEKTAREMGVADYIVKANTSIDEVIDKVKEFLK